MRERTTWNRNEIQRTAAMGKTADPYLMNQDHVSQNPRADKYMNGTPSSWAEDVHSPNEWEKEYSGGATKRDEVGLADFRPETFNHPELAKAASTQLLVKKADLCVKVARQMLGPKVAENVVEDQAVSLMALPDADLIETFQRLAQDQEQGQGQGGQGQPQQQQAAAPAPVAQAQDQQQQASSYQSAAEQCMQAMQQGDQQAMMGAVQQMVQEAMKQQQGSQADFPGGQWGKNNPVASKKAQDQGQEQGGQGQGGQPQQQQAAAPAPVAQQQDQVQQAGMDQQSMQQMVQQAVQQQIQALMQQQGQGQQQEQAPIQEQEQIQVQAGDDALLDQMLAPAPGGDMGPGIGDIELEPPTMDMGEVQLGPDDDVLKTLFATQESQDAEKAQQMSQGQEKQASMVAQPAARTVGTRPSQGVSKVGGASAPAVKTASSDIDKLSNLWSSAPDVREHFGIK
jgi:hypothetical protein